MTDLPEVAEALTVEARKDMSGAMLLKWVAVAEVMADDGERYLMTLNSPDTAVWDAIGLHEFAATKYRKRVDPE